MQDHPLLISTIFEHAVKNYNKQEIVSNTVEGGIHRYTYFDWGKRTKKLANAFKSLDLKESDRVGTLAWNGYRHLEIYYATSSSGLVCHTINPRLHPDQVSYIVNHAQDQVLCVDLNILPELFNGNHSGGYINSHLPSIPIQMMTDEMVYDFTNNPDFPFRLALQENDLYDWIPQSTMYLFHGIIDESVPYQNSVVAYNKFVQNGSESVFFETLEDENLSGFIKSNYEDRKLDKISNLNIEEILEILDLLRIAGNNLGLLLDYFRDKYSLQDLGINKGIEEIISISLESVSYTHLTLPTKRIV